MPHNRDDDDRRSILSDSSANETVSIRKIENGWIITETREDPEKGFESKETFTDKKPDLGV